MYFLSSSVHTNLSLPHLLVLASRKKKLLTSIEHCNLIGYLQDESILLSVTKLGFPFISAFKIFFKILFIYLFIYFYSVTTVCIFSPSLLKYFYCYKNTIKMQYTITQILEGRENHQFYYIYIIIIIITMYVS